MKIRKLQLKNIGVFDDETIEFQPCPVKDKAEIHILTGQNGSGKSTTLQALITLFVNSEITESHESGVQGVFEISKNMFVKKLRTFSETTIGFSVEHKRVIRNYEFMINLLGGFGRAYSPFKYDFNNVVDVSLREYSALANVENWSAYNNSNFSDKFEFAAFAYSGYRRIKDEPIEIGKEVDENSLYKALDFIKDENSKFTVNQWLGRNIIDSSLAKGRDESKAAKVFDEKIRNLEKVINDIISDEINDSAIKFEMRSATKLILIKNNQELDFDVLPDGLKSLISWIGDLLMRLDSLKWENDTSIFDREIILFLDEIEVHLHPAWQRKVLPVVQKLFKNAQIFVSTHSPFVVNSVDDAWVYKFELGDGKAKVSDPIRSEDGYSYETVLREIFDIDKRFGDETQKKLDKFLKESRTIFHKNGNSEISKDSFLEGAKNLAMESAELQSIVFLELAKLTKKTGEAYEI